MLKSALSTLKDQKTMNEIRIMNMLDHPNVLNVYDVIYFDK